MNYQKISKARARRLFNEGTTIYLNTNKARMTWAIPIRHTIERTFDALVNEFSYYNCNGDLGRRVQYFILAD